MKTSALFGLRFGIRRIVLEIIIVRILEIGVGTVATILPIIDTLKNVDYEYTLFYPQA